MNKYIYCLDRDGSYIKRRVIINKFTGEIKIKKVRATRFEREYGYEQTIDVLLGEWRS